MAGPTVFPDLNEVLCDLVKGVRPILEEEGNFCGAYLQGSFAVGGADVHSDVDFLVVVHDEVTPAQETRLRALHARFPDSDVGWAQHLEGSYVPKIALRRVSATRTPWRYVDNGSRVMERSDHDDTAVVRWVLREHGVVLAGPEPAELVDQVTATQLRREVLGTMNEWAAQLRADEDGLDNAWKQPYVVTSYCRMLHPRRRTRHLQGRGPALGLGGAGRDVVQRHPARPRQQAGSLVQGAAASRSRDRRAHLGLRRPRARRRPPLAQPAAANWVWYRSA